MKEQRSFIILFLCLLFLSLLNFSCKEEKKTPKKDPVLEYIGGDYYQDLIRTPVKPDGTIDTANMAKIKFTQDLHNFGTLKQGEKREHSFEFTNNGSLDLIVIDVKSSCGCTVASYSEEPIAPGQTGQININYDSTDRIGVQEKKVIVRTNSFPNQTELTIIADIIK